MSDDEIRRIRDISMETSRKTYEFYFYFEINKKKKKIKTPYGMHDAFLLLLLFVIVITMEVGNIIVNSSMWSYMPCIPFAVKCKVSLSHTIRPVYILLQRFIGL